MTTSNHKEGYKNVSGTGLNNELLASNDFTRIPISIDAAARDWGNPDGSTILRAGLALGWDSSSGRYKQFKSSVHQSSSVVILGETIYDMNTTELVHITSFAYWQADFKKNAIVETESSVTWADVQRIRRRDNDPV